MKLVMLIDIVINRDSLMNTSNGKCKQTFIKQFAYC